MDLLGQLNAAIQYVEQNLCAELDLERAAALACVNTDSFARFFSYMTGVSLKEYVRRRRLTLAARDLREGGERVIDVAVKYGYESADAFSRAFARQHGITPSQYRRNGGRLREYLPVCFRIDVKGAKQMETEIVEISEITMKGVSRQFDGEGFETRESLRNLMWSEAYDDVPGVISGGHRWNEPNSTALDGVWYGVWHDGRYMIARGAADVAADGLETYTLPAGRYAVFYSDVGKPAWEEFPRLWELIFDTWLPASGYRTNGSDVIEVLHLWTDYEQRRANKRYELWVPVK